MLDDEVRVALQRHWAASDANDFVAEHQIYRADGVLEYPQSGERIRGRSNIQASRVAQPSAKRFLRTTHTRRRKSLDQRTRPQVRRATVLRREHNGIRGWGIVRETQYFGEPFAPGPSRAQWVERMEAQTYGDQLERDARVKGTSASRCHEHFKTSACSNDDARCPAVTSAP